ALCRLACEECPLVSCACADHAHGKQAERRQDHECPDGPARKMTYASTPISARIDSVLAWRDCMQRPDRRATVDARACDRNRGRRHLKFLHALWALAALCVAPLAWAEEPDHAIHEELRGVLHEIMAAINSGQYDKMLPYLTENVEATSITQEVMSSRADVSKYFQEWFGPTGYMRKMEMKLDADKLTELSPDKSWGLVRGKALEHYEAKDG